MVGCFTAFEARAAEPARLEWVRLEGAGSCIDAAQLEARVKRRLGSEPFDPRASRSIEGVVRRSGQVWRAQIAVRARPDELNPPLRELESAAADCTSLSSAVVLAVALAIDPAAAFSDTAAKAPLPAPIEAPAAPPSEQAPAQPPPAASEAAVAGRTELTLVSQVGLLPQASLGVGLGVATALAPSVEFGLRARAFPEIEAGADPTYAIGLAALTLDFCWLARPARTVELRICAGPSLGLLHATVLAGDRTQPGQRGSLAAELGLDAAIALTRTLTFELGARAVVPLTRYRFTLEGSDEALFAQSAVAGMAHAGLGLHFDAR